MDSEWHGGGGSRFFLVCFLLLGGIVHTFILGDVGHLSLLVLVLVVMDRLVNL